MSQQLVWQLRRLLAEEQGGTDLHAFYDSMTDGELLAELDTAASCLREGRPYRPHDSQARAQPGDHGLFDHMSNEELLQALRESEARMAEEDPDALLVRGPGKRFS